MRLLYDLYWRIRKPVTPRYRKGEEVMTPSGIWMTVVLTKPSGMVVLARGLDTREIHQDKLTSLREGINHCIATSI